MKKRRPRYKKTQVAVRILKTKADYDWFFNEGVRVLHEKYPLDEDRALTALKEDTSIMIVNAAVNIAGLTVQKLKAQFKQRKLGKAQVAFYQTVVDGMFYARENNPSAECRALIGDVLDTYTGWKEIESDLVQIKEV